MSVEMACTCDDLPAHSHLIECHTEVIVGGGLNHSWHDTGEVRIWVDWKAVARELAAAKATP